MWLLHAISSMTSGRWALVKVHSAEMRCVETHKTSTHIHLKRLPVPPDGHLCFEINPCTRGVAAFCLPSTASQQLTRCSPPILQSTRKLEVFFKVEYHIYYSIGLFHDHLTCVKLWYLFLISAYPFKYGTDNFFVLCCSPIFQWVPGSPFVVQHSSLIFSKTYVMW